jgi:small subunit ribosomal protein S11
MAKDKKPLTRKEKIKKIKTEKVKSKKKTFINVTKGKVYIQSSFNNTIMTLTDDSGRVMAWVSAGALGFKGTKKSTPYTATLIGKAMSDKIRNFGITDVRVYISGVGQGRDAAARALVSSGLNLVSIADITPVPHNGCRPKKPRRV